MMELDATTFILEIINFLVLVWLLQRYLYKPVLAVVAKRKADIDAVLAEAARAKADAAALQQECAGRLAHWEQEKQAADESLQREIDARRNRLLAELHDEIEAERNRLRVIDERRQLDQRQKLEAAALRQAAAFAAMLLQRAAGPETERRLFELLLEQLAELPEATVMSLRNNHFDPAAKVTILSAYVLDGGQRAELQRGLDALFGHALSYAYQEDPNLLAGLRILFGAWVLHVNLQDELSGFAQFAHD